MKCNYVISNKKNINHEKKITTAIALIQFIIPLTIRLRRRRVAFNSIRFKWKSSHPIELSQKKKKKKKKTANIQSGHKLHILRIGCIALQESLFFHHRECVCSVYCSCVWCYVNACAFKCVKCKIPCEASMLLAFYCYSARTCTRTHTICSVNRNYLV